MRRAVPALLLLATVALGGCGGGSSAAAPDEPSPVATAGHAAAGYSAAVRRNFLNSCVDNAANATDGSATKEQLTQTCECILGKVEQEYSETEFAEFEQRLVGGTASKQESGRLTEWSASCAQEATSRP